VLVSFAVKGSATSYSYWEEGTFSAEIFPYSVHNSTHGL